MINMELLGEMIGNWMLALKSGKPLVIEPSSSYISPMFNWAQIERWGVDPNHLPAESVFINRPLTLWGQYKVEVVSATFLIVILSTMTIVLVIQNRRRKFAEMAVRESAVQLAAERDLLEERVIERTADIKNQRDLLAQKNEELEAAFFQIKRLEGIIPICMYCKKIRDDQNTWNQLEQYITEHSEAMFSHSMCPQCYEKQEKIL